MFHKLQTKIMMILIVVISITLTINYMISNSIMKKSLMDAFHKEAFSVGQSIQLYLEDIIDNDVVINEITLHCKDAVEASDEMKFILLYDASGHVLYGSDLSFQTLIDETTINTWIDCGTELVDKVSANDKSYLCFIVPVLDAKNQVQIEIVIGYLTEEVKSPIRLLSNSMFILSALVCGLSIIIMTILFHLWITKPLLSLVKSTNEILESDSTQFHPVKVRSNDEIGILGQSYNRMLHYLNETMVSKSYLNNIISSMPDALLVINNDLTIATCNQACLDKLGYDRDEMENHLIFEFMSKSISKEFNEENIKLHTSQIRKGSYEIELLCKSGTMIPFIVSGNAIQNSNSQQYVCTLKDISERIEAEKEVAYQAKHDMLTGLCNRYALDEEIMRICNDIKESKQMHVFLYLDLDKFKVINDVCGHHAGDALIQQLGLIMKKNLRDCDMLARLGGDEFAVLLPDTTIDVAIKIGERLCQVIRKFRFTHKDKQFTLGVSIGAVEITSEFCDTKKVILAADKACYQSKQQGGNRVCVYNDGIEFEGKQTDQRETPKIVSALQEGRFKLVYQPMIATSNLQTIGYEVLLRMQDEEGNTIMPGSFLPAASRYDMLMDIDRYVITNFCETCTIEPGFRYCINLFGDSLNDETLFDFIHDNFLKYQIDPTAICFELAETSAISNYVTANKFILKIKDIGCKVTLDDFGSGLSSYTYLKYLPVDYVKIDGSYIRDIVENEVDYALASSIHEIAQLLGKETIAEFVENEEIYECLKKIGVNYVQGYYFGEPE